MILADKILNLRKKAGWSQEELAAQLNVSRQSVSKWEGAQSIPDMDKILQMSRLFGVSTDFLLKDEIEADASMPATEAADAPLRRVRMEDASSYLELRREAAPKTALATFLCVISPIPLILLAGLSEIYQMGISESVAAGIGMVLLLILVAIGVTIFLRCDSKVQDFKFLEKEPFETEYGVSGMVREREKAFREHYTTLNVVGTVLCILSAVPLFIAISMDGTDIYYIAAVCILLFLVALGCIAFVYGGTIRSSMDKLLEEGDYTRDNKARSGLVGTVSVIYWLSATALFFFLSFGVSGGDPKQTWYIWPIAGVLFAAVLAVLKLVHRKEK